MTGQAELAQLTIPRSYWKRLQQPKMRDFLRYLRRSATSANLLKLGWRVHLNADQQSTAAEMNRLFSGLVWGYCDDSYVSQIDTAESRLLTKWLSKTVWGARVLEVGCGSGRLTTYLSPLVHKLTAIEREKSAVMRARARVSPRRGLSIVCADLSSFSTDERFTCILLMENMLGMNPQPKKRARLISRAFDLLTPNGILIIGLRVMRQPRDSVSFFQAIPYDVNTVSGKRREIIAVVVVWTVKGFLYEFPLSLSRIEILDSTTGSLRKVGGKMHYLIMRKGSDSA